MPVALGWKAGARTLATGCLTTIGTRVVVVACVFVSATTVIGSWRNLWFELSGKVVEGVVVRQAEELVADWNDPTVAGRPSGVRTTAATRLFSAIVEFKDGDRQYQIEARSRTSVQIYGIGSKVDVVFPPGRPHRAQLRPELPDFWTESGLMLVGTLLGVGAAYWWWKHIRRRGRINPLPGGRSNVSGG